MAKSTYTTQEIISQVELILSRVAQGKHFDRSEIMYQFRYALRDLKAVIPDELFHEEFITEAAITLAPATALTSRYTFQASGGPDPRLPDIDKILYGYDLVYGKIEKKTPQEVMNATLNPEFANMLILSVESEYVITNKIVTPIASIMLVYETFPAIPSNIADIIDLPQKYMPVLIDLLMKYTLKAHGISDGTGRKANPVASN